VRDLLSKADVIKQWKPELKSFGFQFRDGAFVWAERPEGHLDLLVSVQKNVRNETYKINPSIAFRNTLLSSANLELLLLGNLQPNGIFHHVARSSWWPSDALKDAMGMLKQHVMEWYHRVGRAHYLVDVVEAAIREVKGIAGGDRAGRHVFGF
jgi:hypothetical protein